MAVIKAGDLIGKGEVKEEAPKEPFKPLPRIILANDWTYWVGAGMGIAVGFIVLSLVLGIVFVCGALGFGILGAIG